MNQKLYTLAVAHSDYPAAEIFTSERAALQRRLELSEVSDSQRDQLLHLFDARDRNAYDKALNHLESEVSVVCAIEEHELGDDGASAKQRSQFAAAGARLRESNDPPRF